MSKKTVVKRIIDLAMTVVLILLMAYSLIGEALHEWLGAAMLLLFLIHHLLNAAWYKALGKGRYTPYRTLQSILAALLFLTMLGSMGSGMVLSRFVFDFLPIHSGQGTARMVHLCCAYWGFILMSLHIGLHWRLMLTETGRIFDVKPSPVRTVLLRALAVCIALYGVAAFFRNDILSYLLLRTHFVFFDYERPLILFFADYLAIMGLFVFIAYYLGKKLQTYGLKRKKGRESQ